MAFVDDFLADLGNRAGGRGKRFAQRYWSDIPGFFRDVLLAPLHPYQVAAGRLLQEYHRLALFGPHAFGKTFFTAGCIIHFSLTREAGCVDWKLVSTASANRQLRQYLWPEVHRLLRRVRWEIVGIEPWTRGDEELDMELKGYYGRAFGAATEHEGMIEGAHATEMAFYFDESKHIKASVFDAAEGALAQAGVGGRNAYALAVSTPGDPEGRFFDICTKKEGFEDWKVRHVTKAEAIEAGQMSEAWAKARARHWKPKSAIYLNRVEGVFATSGAQRKVVLLQDVERAVERGYALLEKLVPGTGEGEPGQLELPERWRRAAALLPGLTGIGADVGKGGIGRDPATIARRSNQVVFPVEVLPPSDDSELELVGRVVAIGRANPGAVAVIDAIGAGACVSLIRQEGIPVVGFVASHTSDAKDKNGELGFVNLRAEAWWAMRERLHDAFSDVILPDDDTLTRELTEPEYEVKTGGKIQIESKEAVSKRLTGAEDREDEGGSTNRADAVIQSWFTAVASTEGIGAPKVVRARRLTAI